MILSGGKHGYTGCTCCSGWICSLYYQQELLATLLCIATISDIKIRMFIHPILNKLP